MRILLSNDDGIDAPGLGLLERLAAEWGEVWVVAPDRERSASSHALTMNAPLRVKEMGERRFAVDGTPADCAYMGIHHLLPERPDWVLAGVNRGANLGTDVLYSGTVAIAAEACIQGVPSAAFSLAVDWGKAARWDTAEVAIRKVLARMFENAPPRGGFLNVNVPDVAPDALAGLAAARQVRRAYSPRVDKREDPWHRPYYWIGGPHAFFEDAADGDGPLMGQGWITVSAMRPQWNDLKILEETKKWTDR